jgi:hypothetical protein
MKISKMMYFPQVEGPKKKESCRPRVQPTIEASLLNTDLAELKLNVHETIALGPCQEQFFGIHEMK